MTGEKKHVWTPARVESLKALVASGLTASQIAKRLDGRFTRCAVIGKARRMNFGPIGGGKASKPASPRRKDPIPRLNVQVLRAARKGPPTKPLPVQPAPVVVVAPMTGKPWLERQFGECAYIVAGEGVDAMACCAPNGERVDWPYCDAHRKVIFQKPRSPAQRVADAERAEAMRMSYLRKRRAA